MISQSSISNLKPCSGNMHFSDEMRRIFFPSTLPRPVTTEPATLNTPFPFLSLPPEIRLQVYDAIPRVRYADVTHPLTAVNQSTREEVLALSLRKLKVQVRGNNNQKGLSHMRLLNQDGSLVWECAPDEKKLDLANRLSQIGELECTSSRGWRTLVLKMHRNDHTPKIRIRSEDSDSIEWFLQNKMCGELKAMIERLTEPVRSFAWIERIFEKFQDMAKRECDLYMDRLEVVHGKMPAAYMVRDKTREVEILAMYELSRLLAEEYKVDGFEPSDEDM
jgi:hypothetical protein